MTWAEAFRITWQLAVVVAAIVVVCLAAGVLGGAVGQCWRRQGRR